MPRGYKILVILISIIHALNLYNDAEERPATRRLVVTHSFKLPAKLTVPLRHLNHNLLVAACNIR